MEDPQISYVVVARNQKDIMAEHSSSRESHTPFLNTVLKKLKPNVNARILAYQGYPFRF